LISGLPLVDLPSFHTPKPSPGSIADASEKTKSNTLPSPPQQSHITLQSPMPNATVSAFGLGRPSSRPIRSSPLANTPITGAQGEHSLVSSELMPTTNVILEVKTPVSEQAPHTHEASSVQISSAGDLANTIFRRPKTPPLLGILSTPAITLATSMKTAGTDHDDQENSMHPMQVGFQHAYQAISEELSQVLTFL
jgi:nucleoporin NUP159